MLQVGFDLIVNRLIDWCFVNTIAGSRCLPVLFVYIFKLLALVILVHLQYLISVTSKMNFVRMANSRRL
jgi:hypothetical protein